MTTLFAPVVPHTESYICPFIGVPEYATGDIEYSWVLKAEGYYEKVYNRSSVWDFLEEEGFHSKVIKYFDGE